MAMAAAPRRAGAAVFIGAALSEDEDEDSEDDAPAAPAPPLLSLPLPLLPVDEAPPA